MHFLFVYKKININTKLSYIKLRAPTHKFCNYVQVISLKKEITSKGYIQKSHKSRWLVQIHIGLHQQKPKTK